MLMMKCTRELSHEILQHGKQHKMPHAQRGKVLCPEEIALYSTNLLHFISHKRKL